MVYLQVEVEPVYALLEARWVEEQAKKDPRIQGIVAWAPLEYGDQARAFLDALRESTPHLKGIRRFIQFEPNLDFCLQPGFVRGVQLLADYDLSFDICIDHRHFPNTIRLIRQCPQVPCILDHIGKPNIKEQHARPLARPHPRAGRAAERRLQGQRHGDGGRPSALDAATICAPSWSTCWRSSARTG